MQNNEMICGFWVRRFPEKPDYLPITQKEFEQCTLEAWCNSYDETDRVAAVFRGGSSEWETLCHDDSLSVRGALACRASEQYQLLLTDSPEPIIRKQLAVYGTDKVRHSLLDAREADLEVLTELAKYGSISLRHRLVDVAWSNPEAIRKIVRYLPASDIEKLLAHPKMEVRIDAARFGNIDQCLRVLKMPYPSQNTNLTYMRTWLLDRIRDLEEVAQALGQPQTKHRRIEMELSP